MVLKQKSLLIVIISSLVIASVLALTIFGFYAYLEGKEKKIKRNYRLAIYDVNAQLFEKYIAINLKATIDQEGISKNKPVIEGTIKNTSDKKIYSLKMKIAFCNPEGEVVYADTLYPVGSEFESPVNIGEIAKKTKSFLLEGDSISFVYQLKNTPPEVRDYLKSCQKFVKAQDAGHLELVYKIEGLDIK